MGQPTPQLSTSVDKLSGVGTKIREKLERLGIYSIQDLLFHLPYRYIDRTQLLPMGSLVPGQDALTQGTVELTQVKFGKRRSLLCRISDGTGALTLRFFHFTQSQQSNLQKGTLIRCWGQVRRGQQTLEMAHPEYQRLYNENEELEQTLTPVYSTTEGLGQAKLRRLTEQSLNILARDSKHLDELLPATLLKEYKLPNLGEALRYVHRPPPEAELTTLKDGNHPSQQRLAFEELLAQHLSLRSLRQQVHSYTAPSLAKYDGKLLKKFLAGLSFQLTGAQQKVLADIQADIVKELPMLRLVQGDVGSGKTIVAALAALQAISAGYQVALMAPTELLAIQHFSNMQQWLSELDIEVILLSGKQKRSEHAASLEKIASNKTLIVVGTHALFQEQVLFTRLGLIIIDEQHRFGVHQRLALMDKGVKQSSYPHQLVMTATPIPRTLAMTIFADLDISIIDELPPGRQEIQTIVLSNKKREEVIERIAGICAEGRQVYWVCHLIEESDVIQSQAAIEANAYLDEKLPHFRVGLIHGKMKSAEKEQAMKEFSSGNIHVLVATTVIEVGVDVPNASLMVIENAERMGLSQLHQLRGRVGRGSQKSDCVLMYQSPLSELAQARLETMRETTDGFAIAQKDLELRGPGDMLGTRQTGLPELRIADLIRDAKLIPQVQKVADTLLTDYPDTV